MRLIFLWTLLLFTSRGTAFTCPYLLTCIPCSQIPICAYLVFTDGSTGCTTVDTIYATGRMVTFVARTAFDCPDAASVHRGHISSNSNTNNNNPDGAGDPIHRGYLSPSSSANNNNHADDDEDPIAADSFTWSQVWGYLVNIGAWFISIITFVWAIHTTRGYWRKMGTWVRTRKDRLQRMRGYVSLKEPLMDV